MESTTFNNKIIPQINKLLKFVLENPYSDFYKNKYKGLGIKEIKSYEDFQKIPLLTKDEILAVPIEKRTFVNEDKIVYYSLSGGTTSSKPMVIPHSSFYIESFNEYTINEKEVKSLEIDRLMALLQSTSPILQKMFCCPRDPIIVMGDINNLGSAAKIAKELEIQGIYSVPTRLYYFIEHLKKIDFDFKQIKFISVGGEYCSNRKAAFFRSSFPSAFIDFRFGNTEIGGNTAYRCPYLDDIDKPNIFHPVNYILNEVVDERKKILQMNEIGELIHTDLEIKAFPLIRYETKDIVQLSSKESCPCGNSHKILICGRLGFDSLKIHNYMIDMESIEKALDAASPYIEIPFQMHIFEEKNGEDSKLKIKLHLKLNEKFKHLSNELPFKQEVEKRITENLYLSSNTNLNHLISKKQFLPLELVFEPSWPDEPAKWKSIISHIPKHF